MMWYVEAARLVLLAVASLKVAEATTGTRTLPQNPLDLGEWSKIFTSVDQNTLLIAGGTFFVLLLLVIIIKKKRQRYQQIVYVPVPSSQQFPPQSK